MVKSDSLLQSLIPAKMEVGLSGDAKNLNECESTSDARSHFFGRSKTQTVEFHRIDPFQVHPGLPHLFLSKTQHRIFSISRGKI